MSSGDSRKRTSNTLGQRCSKKPRLLDTWNPPQLEMIQKTPDIPWSPRAEVDDADLDNEAFIRTYHPSLANIDDVWAVSEPTTGERIWVVQDTRAGLEAGGRPIHLMPSRVVGVDVATAMADLLRFVPDGMSERLDPRTILSPSAIGDIRAAFPCATGVHILVSGFVVIMYRSEQDVRRAISQHGCASTWGALPVFFAVEEILPSHAPGTPITNSATAVSYASMGLRLRFPDGTEALTVVTHAFVALPTLTNRVAVFCANLILKAAQWADRKFKFGRMPIPAIVQGGGANARTPIGKDVFLLDTKQKIGTITKTYDPVPVSSMFPYPYGFEHDLSLVTGDDLPDTRNNPHNPRIVGWGKAEELLAGGRCFVSGQNIDSGKEILLEGTGISPDAKKAVVEGMRYAWSQTPAVARCLLWRTENDWDTVAALSGSVLCLGDPREKEALAVCFQNFQYPVPVSRELDNDYRGPGKGSLPLVKEGFMLPEEITNATIVMRASDERRIVSHPVRAAYESGQDGGRRALQGEGKGIHNIIVSNLS